MFWYSIDAASIASERQKNCGWSRAHRVTCRVCQLNASGEGQSRKKTDAVEGRKTHEVRRNHLYARDESRKYQHGSRSGSGIRVEGLRRTWSIALHVKRVVERNKLGKGALAVLSQPTKGDQRLLCDWKRQGLGDPRGSCAPPAHRSAEGVDQGGADPSQRQAGWLIALAGGGQPAAATRCGLQIAGHTVANLAPGTAVVGLLPEREQAQALNQTDLDDALSEGPAEHVVDHLVEVGME